MAIFMPCPECGGSLDRGLVFPCSHCGWKASDEQIVDALRCASEGSAAFTGMLARRCMIASLIATLSIVLNVALGVMLIIVLMR